MLSQEILFKPSTENSRNEFWRRVKALNRECQNHWVSNWVPVSKLGNILTAQSAFQKAELLNSYFASTHLMHHLGPITFQLGCWSIQQPCSIAPAVTSLFKHSLQFGYRSPWTGNDQAHIIPIPKAPCRGDAIRQISLLGVLSKLRSLKYDCWPPWGV